MGVKRNSINPKNIHKSKIPSLKNEVFVINKLNVIWTHPSITGSHFFSSLSISFPYFANTLLSSWWAIPAPTQLSVSCPTITAQPLTMVSASNRQLDSKCHPVLLPARGRELIQEGGTQSVTARAISPGELCGQELRDNFLPWGGPVIAGNCQHSRERFMGQEMIPVLACDSTYLSKSCLWLNLPF